MNRTEIQSYFHWACYDHSSFVIKAKPYNTMFSGYPKGQVKFFIKSLSTNILWAGTLQPRFEKMGGLLDLGRLSFRHSVIPPLRLSIIILFPLNILRKSL